MRAVQVSPTDSPHPVMNTNVFLTDRCELSLLGLVVSLTDPPPNSGGGLKRPGDCGNYSGREASSTGLPKCKKKDALFLRMT